MILNARKSLSHLANLPLGSVLLLTNKKWTRMPPMMARMSETISQIAAPVPSLALYIGETVMLSLVRYDGYILTPLVNVTLIVPQNCKKR